MIAQSLRNRCIIAAQLIHNHCAITAQSLRNNLAITAQLLRNHLAITAQSLHYRSAIALQSLRNHLAMYFLHSIPHSNTLSRIVRGSFLVVLCDPVNVPYSLCYVYCVMGVLCYGCAVLCLTLLWSDVVLPMRALCFAVHPSTLQHCTHPTSTTTL
jgi:hypothetical protein